MRRCFFMAAVSGLACLATGCLRLATAPAGPAAKPTAPKGPKLWVGVMEFEDRTGPAWRKWQLGRGMSDQLVTALMKTGRFNVLERERLEKILAEQDLAETGRAAEGEFARTGQVLRCQYLIKGSVTEFQYRKSTGAKSIRTPWGVTLGGGRSFGHVAVDIRMVDTTTGQIIAAKKARGRAEGRWVMFNVSTPTWGFGSRNFQQTPIGKAVRQCIEEAMQKVVRSLGRRPFFTTVLALEEGAVLIAGGRDLAITPGLRFTIKSRKPDLVDPVTGRRIARYEPAGEVQVRSVEDEYSTCVPLEGEGFKRGDRAELVKE